MYWLNKKKERRELPFLNFGKWDTYWLIIAAIHKTFKLITRLAQSGESISMGSGSKELAKEIVDIIGTVRMTKTTS